MTILDEASILYIHSQGETWLNKIYNLLVAFCVFGLAIFIIGVLIIKREVHQTIMEEFDSFQDNRFPKGPRKGQPGKKGKAENGKPDKNEDDDDPNDQDDNDDRSEPARLLLSDLKRKDQQQNGRKPNVILSGNGMILNNGTGKGKPSAFRRPTVNNLNLRCGSCGLYPYAVAPQAEHDEIFPITSNPSTDSINGNQRRSMALMKSSNEGTFDIYEVLPSSQTMRNRFTQQAVPQQSEQYLNYLGGVIHNSNIHDNESSNNVSISTHDQRTRSLWEDITNRDELYTNVNYFRSTRNFS